MAPWRAALVSQPERTVAQASGSVLAVGIALA